MTQLLSPKTTTIEQCADEIVINVAFGKRIPEGTGVILLIMQHVTTGQRRGLEIDVQSQILCPMKGGSA